MGASVTTTASLITSAVIRPTTFPASTRMVTVPTMTRIRVLPAQPPTGSSSSRTAWHTISTSRRVAVRTLTAATTVSTRTTQMVPMQPTVLRETTWVPCHAGGACVCSSSTYYGPGCTKTGRGHHAAPKKQVSGDIRNLICDKSGLTPSHPMRATVTVNRATPELVTFTTTRVQSDGSTAAAVIANVSHVKVGNRIRIGEQVRTIVSRSSADNYMVDSPFKEDEFSGITAIFPWYTPVEIVESESASYLEEASHTGTVTVDNDLELATCMVTDIRALSSTTEHCAAAYSGSHGQTPHCAKGDAQGTGDYDDRVVTLEGSGVLMDRREVRLGDRVRRIKVEG